MSLTARITALAQAVGSDIKTALAHIGSRGSAHGIATTSEAGFLSATDKTKLDSMSAGASGDANAAVASHVAATDPHTAYYNATRLLEWWNAKRAAVDITGGSIDGTAIGQTTPAAGKFTTLTTSSTVTHNGGTANGVAYLNGSKVLTTGSALTFDGTTFAAPLTSLSGNGVVLSVDRTGTGGNDRTNVQFSNSGTVRGGIGTVGASDGIYFNYGTTEGMRLTSTGLGIGTSSPTNALSVSGNANITGNTTLGDATTDTVTVNGYMGVGGAGNAGQGLRLTSNALTGASQYGAFLVPVGTSSGTTAVYGLAVAAGTAASAYTANVVRQIYTGDAVKGAGSTITSLQGIYVDDLTAGTNNYGITSLVSSGSNKWNIYASGTASNYFAGNVGIGTSSPQSKLHLSGATPTSTTILQLGGDSTSTGVVLEFSGSANAFLWNKYNGYLSLGTNNTERLRLDNSGNLGLGVTPSTWGSTRALQVNRVAVANTGGTGRFATNWYNDGTDRYLTTDFASLYQQNDGQHRFYTAPAGTAGQPISFTQAMALSSAGLSVAGTGTFGGSVTAAGMAIGVGVLTLHESGVRSWELQATGGNVRLQSGDGMGRFTAPRMSTLLIHACDPSMASSYPDDNVIGASYPFNGARQLVISLSAVFRSAASSPLGSSTAVLSTGHNTDTGRSIDATGTINASGADYAEHEYNNGYKIVKGQIVGFDAEGKLTTVFADALRFAVKSTEPGYTGGNAWMDDVPACPHPPAKPVVERPSYGADEDVNHDADTDALIEQEYQDALAAAEIEYQAAFAKYEAEKAIHDAAMLDAVSKVDRIAYCGKVPVNYHHAEPGQYLIAAEDSEGGITCVAVWNPSLSEYLRCIGRVNKVLPDGRAEIAVIIH